jgi:hypothetical protein
MGLDDRGMIAVEAVMIYIVIKYRDKLINRKN